MRLIASTLTLVLAVTVYRAGAVEQTPAAARPRITGISHVALRTTDVSAARRFYGALRGLKDRPIAGTSRIAFDIGGRQHLLVEPGLTPVEDERLDHVAFETSDIKALGAYLSSRGVPAARAERQKIASPPCDPGAIWVNDPDGHLIEFVQAPWPPAQRSPESSRALSRRLLHAGLTIRDEEAAHAFYREALGFSEIWRGGRKEGVTQWVNMRVPDGTEYLEYMLITAIPDRRQRGVLHHAALMVPDMQNAWEEAVRRSPDSPERRLGSPQVGVNGRWQFNLFDPDGTRIELMEPFRVR